MDEYKNRYTNKYINEHMNENQQWKGLVRNSSLNTTRHKALVTKRNETNNLVSGCTKTIATGTDGKELIKKVNDPKLDLVKGLDLYNDLDRKIAQLNQSIYFLREQKNHLNEKLISIVKSKKMHNKNLVLNGIKYKYSNSNPPVTVTKNYIREKLIKFFKGNEKKADLLVNYIYNNRERTSKEEIHITRF